MENHIELSFFVLSLSIETLLKRSGYGRIAGRCVDNDSAWDYKAWFDLACVETSVPGTLSDT
jgi:hypothetical protein